MKKFLSVLICLVISASCGPSTTPKLPSAATIQPTCDLTDSHGHVIRPSRLLVAWLLADGPTWHEWTEALIAAGQTHVWVTMASGDYTLDRQPTMYPAYLTALEREGLTPVIAAEDATKLAKMLIDGRPIDLPDGVVVSPTWAIPEECR